VRWIELVGFRGYASLSFTPDPGLNALVGPNGHGKTSLLEAFHVLLTGRSFRTPRLVDCVSWDAGGETTLAGEVEELEHGRRTLRLSIVARDAGAELRGPLCAWSRAVSFQATDLALIHGEPLGRRAYLDGAVARLVPAHGETCRRYRLVLHQRTRLLRDLTGRAEGARLLDPWDEQLAGLGSEIVHRRLDVLATLAPEAQVIREALMPDRGPLALRYEASVAPDATPAATREALRTALVASRPQDLRRGLTLVGPHRDDLAIRLGRGDARVTASRGEQRILTLILRLAEAAAVRRRLGTSPVFLLDDLLSELDPQARLRALTWLGAQGQVLFSGADLGGEARGAVHWEVKNAEVGVHDALARGAA
jgi:DNA replication and repair protein RecF